MPDKVKVDAMSIVAFILSFTYVASAIGLILGIATMIRKNVKKERIPRLAIAAVIIGSILTFIFILPIANNNSTKNITTTKKTTTKKTTTEETSTKEFVFEPVVILDNEECKITITEIDVSTYSGYSISTKLENKSETNYTFSIDYATINNVEVETHFFVDVAAGKKSNNIINFSTDILKNNGINKFTDIAITFDVYETSDAFRKSIVLETVHVYPYSEDNATSYSREDKSTDRIIIDNDVIKMVLVSEDDDPIWGYTQTYYLENKIDEDIYVSLENTSVNGYMVTPSYNIYGNGWASTSIVIWGNILGAGNSAFRTLSISDSKFASNEIENVEEFEFELKITDAPYSGTVYFDDIITIDLN